MQRLDHAVVSAESRGSGAPFSPFGAQSSQFGNSLQKSTYKIVSYRPALSILRSRSIQICAKSSGIFSFETYESLSLCRNQPERPTKTPCFWQTRRNSSRFSSTFETVIGFVEPQPHAYQTGSSAKLPVSLSAISWG